MLVVTEENLEEVVEYVVVEKLPVVEEKSDLPELLSTREELLPELAALVTAEKLVPPELVSRELAPPEEAAPSEEAVPAEELVSPEPVPPEEPVSPGNEAVTFGIVCPVEIGRSFITLLSPKPPEAEP